jgi:ApaG protein
VADTKRYEITVEAHATYVAEQTDPSQDQYVFAYRIKVTNTGTASAQS